MRKWRHTEASSLPQVIQLMGTTPESSRTGLFQARTLPHRQGHPVGPEQRLPALGASTPAAPTWRHEPATAHGWGPGEQLKVTSHGPLMRSWGPVPILLFRAPPHSPPDSLQPKPQGPVPLSWAPHRVRPEVSAAAARAQGKVKAPACPGPLSTELRSLPERRLAVCHLHRQPSLLLKALISRLVPPSMPFGIKKNRVSTALPGPPAPLLAAVSASVKQGGCHEKRFTIALLNSQVPTVTWGSCYPRLTQQVWAGPERLRFQRAPRPADAMGTLGTTGL